MPAAIAIPAIATAIAGGSSAAAGIYSAHKQGSAAARAAQLQTDAANHAADLEAKSAADALTFARQQEATRQQEFNQTQAQNFGQYQEQQARLSPFRQLGAGAVSQLGQPIPRGSIGAYMGGR